ncbi:MAG: hypothetical protein A3H29_18610 [Acidobacteria bacterium RIFCSPLOWO2_02_FULL_67_21]|nr:MAG: hypothetical protein A3H29_18610 [Acidobacteria bacterium RIFCSPLOWO2_02_FULL_67_21]
MPQRGGRITQVEPEVVPPPVVDNADEHEEIRIDIETRPLPLFPGVLNELVAEAGRRELTAALDRDGTTRRSVAAAEKHQQVVEDVP